MFQLHQSIDSVLNLKVKTGNETRSMLNPYFYFLRDSALTNHIPRKTSFDSTNFIDNFPAKHIDNIISRANANARTVKYIIQNPSSQASMIQNSLMRYKIEYHRKITLSLVIIVLFLIGAPMGAIIRKGGLGMPSVVSIFLFILYHVIAITGEKLAKRFVLEPFEGMWLPVFILLPISVFLVIQANKDSIIFSKEAYSRLFTYIASIFTKSMKNSHTA